MSKKKEKKFKCPNCGYCEECGRSDKTKEYIPWPIPYSPYPWYRFPRYPTDITWDTTSGTDYSWGNDVVITA